MKYFLLVFLCACCTSPTEMFEDDFSSDYERRCFYKCDYQNRAAIISEFGCFCGSELDFLRKFYPSRYKKKVK